MQYGMTKEGGHDRGKKVRKMAQMAFQKKAPYLTLWQSIAELFYPTRADFTMKHSEASEYFEDLYTSIPSRIASQSANNIGRLLRPQSTNWFKCVAKPEELMDEKPVQNWVEDATVTLRRIIYDNKAMFSRAMAESDLDFVCFGNSVISHTYYDDVGGIMEPGILFRCYHLRDCAWKKNHLGVIDHMFIKLEKTLGQWRTQFGQANLPEKWQRACDQDQLDEKRTVFMCVTPIEQGDYDGQERNFAMPAEAKFKMQYVSADDEADCCIKEDAYSYFPFTVRQWQSVAGEDYARSPCTSVALGDARAMNTMEYAILKSVELNVEPIKIVDREAILDDRIGWQAGDVIYANVGPDRGNRPIVEYLQNGEVPLAMDWRDRAYQEMRMAFFLHILDIPQKPMTAYEVRQRLAAQLADASPIFEPLEADLRRMLGKVFEMAMTRQAFGPLEDIPQSLQGRQVEIDFDTPLTQAKESEVVQQYEQVMQMTMQTVQSQHPDAMAALDYIKFDDMTRHVLKTSVPSKWERSDEEAASLREQKQQAQQEAQEQQMAMEAGQAAMSAKPENLRMLQRAVNGEPQ